MITSKSTLSAITARHLLLVVAVLLGLIFYGCEKSESSVFQRSSPPNFSAITDTSEKKARFFNYFLPIVIKENNAIIKQRIKLREIDQRGYPIRNKGDLRFIQKIAEEYKIESAEFSTQQALMKRLLRRVDAIPSSLVLAQAAKESGWGTSRFAREGNNYFGQWCYQKGCGIVPKKRNAGASHEVAHFKNTAHSVRAYLYNINSSDAYKDFRLKRESLRRNKQSLHGNALAAGLERYSERRAAYVTEVKLLIKHNGLSTFDDAYVTPAKPIYEF